MRQVFPDGLKTPCHHHSPICLIVGMTILLINFLVMNITLINIIVMTIIIDILSTSFYPGLGDGWGMKPSLGRPEVNKCKMQDYFANLQWHFCNVVPIHIYVYYYFDHILESTHVSDVEARRIGFPPSADSWWLHICLVEVVKDNNSHH